MVVTDRERADGEELERRDDLGADERMLPHQRPLIVVELDALAQHHLGDADLSDVVEESSLADDVGLLRLEPERHRDTPTRGADALGVTARVRVLRFERVGQAEQRLIDRAVQLLIQPLDVLGVAERLLVCGAEPAIGGRRVGASLERGGRYPRCHTMARGRSVSISPSSLTGEKGFVR